MSIAARVLVALAATTTAALVTACPAQAPAESAAALLEKSAAAYRAAPALVDRMTLDVQVPMQDPQKIEIEYALGAGTDGVLKLFGLEATAKGDRVAVIRDEVPDKIVDVALDGDLAKTIQKLIGEVSYLPVGLDMRANRGQAAYLRALGLRTLENVQLGETSTVNDREGNTVRQIMLTAKNGEGRLRLDAKTHFVRQLTLEIEVPNVPQRITADARFDPQVRSSITDLLILDRTGRTPVKSVRELQRSPLAVGDMAPDFSLTALDGSTVSLSSLRGSVVVLDFWATWCKPCRMGLPLLQKFHQWVQETSQPVKVFAIDTFERTPSADATRNQARTYWTKERFTMPTLFDLDSAVIGRYGYNSIPVTIIVDTDGRVAAIHRGYDPRMTETLKRDVGRVLAAGGG